MDRCKPLVMSDDMKDLMNQVTEAKKAAEANLIGRGRDAGCPAPPTQIPASGTTELGSYLGFK